MYRRDGPEETKPIGETEFVHAIAQSTSGQHGPARVLAGIIGYANLTLGAGVARVLEGHLAASPDRFRGIRQICVWDTDPAVPITAQVPKPGLMLDSTFRAGFACLKRYKLSFETFLYWPAPTDWSTLRLVLSGDQF
jgi:hypothetical protein